MGEGNRQADNRWAVYRGRSNASGQVTDLGTLILDQFGGPDTDGDGIPDAGEYALGTNPNSRDSDGDGLSDDAELTQGLNPNDGRSFPTGIIASLPLRGEAKEVVVEENLAYVATGSYGLAIVDVSRFDTPIILGQLDLPGDATDVAVDTTLKLAVVATGASGLQFVDVSDPMQPRVTRTISLISSRVEILLGMVFAATANSVASIDLRTGQTLQTLNLGGSALTDITSEGTFLYTMDAGRRLRVVEFASLLMTARGTLTLAQGAGRLFVGNGIAYVPAASIGNNNGGFSTVSVLNSNAPLLLSAPSNADGLPSSALIPNGSGVGLLVGTIFPTSPVPQPRCVVMDLQNPAITSNSLTRYILPAGPVSAAIASGISFIANGANGLQVLNYQAFDSRGLPPTIALAASFAVTNQTNGVVEEGRTVRVAATVTDDVQVRDVEFFLDGVSVRRDGSFPFEYRFVTPQIRPGTNSFRLRARATDTGGNFAWSEEMVVMLVNDMSPPLVVRVYPSAGSTVASNSFVAAYLNEPLAPATITPATFQLESAGADGRFGTPDDARVTNGVLAYSAELNAVFLTFATNLPAGVYRASLNPPLADASGNAFTNSYRWGFVTGRSLCVVRPTDCTDSDGDGIPNSLEAGLGLNAFNADSNGNGIRDGDEDYDGDGIGNAAEILLSLDPKRADTDRDGLTDWEEIFIHGTDPLNPDMDGDGWPDGFEIAAGTDPRNAASHPAQRFSVASPAVTLFNVPPLEPGPSLRSVFSPVVSYENQ